ncbi:MAG: hypothetical protein ABIR17_08810 [Pseudolysinimonas sp.]|uniref:hypothetical protein n=1 Tax=Pseudolysinimonas sp. TaxID=2680009 RepID=UPI003266A553
MIRLMVILVGGVVMGLTSCSASGAPAPTPSPTASSGAVSCTSILQKQSLDELVDSGLDLADPAAFSADLHAQKDPFAAFFDVGGVLCEVVDGTTPVEWYGWAPFTKENSADFRAALVSAGWTETPTASGADYALDPLSTGVVFACSFDYSGGAACGYDQPRLDEIFGNVPAR